MLSVRHIVRGGFVALVACGSQDVVSPGEAPPRPSTTLPAPSPSSTVDPSPDASDLDARTEGAAADASPAPRIVVTPITTSHRAIPGQMFGGWGPHLGHLVRASGGELFFVDDACEAQGPTACDVNRNTRLDAWAFDEATRTWKKRGSVALSGVQQNTGTIARGGTLFSYGVSTEQNRVVECALVPATAAAWSCTTVPIVLPPQTNYVGAAVSPDGHKLVWATTVQDGGGGTFHWLVDYGGGFNGPRTGGVGGYNDASYVHVSFLGGAQKGRFVAHAQLVAGLAPAWTFHAATSEGDVTSTSPLTFALLAGDASDPVISTNDVLVDPRTNDAHLVARTRAGDATYHFRPAGGAWSGPLAVWPKTFRARLSLLADGTLAAIHTTPTGLVTKLLAPRDVRAGAPADWSRARTVPIPLPRAYVAPLALYTEEATYQGRPPPAVSFAVVGADEREVTYVRVDP